MIYLEQRCTSHVATEWDGSLIADHAPPADWLWTEQELQMLHTQPSKE